VRAAIDHLEAKSKTTWQWLFRPVEGRHVSGVALETRDEERGAGAAVISVSGQ
jgi:hypothetical protein